MAIIGTIRKNGWILIGLMTLALGGFILMDIISNAQRYSAGDVNMLGKVNGQEIKRSEFDTYEKLIYTNSKGNTYQVRQTVWNYFVENALVSQEAEKLGLGVGKEELMDLQFGNNISPVVAERFKGQDGRPNMATLASIKAAIEQGSFTDPTNRAYWSVQEKEVIKERLQEKLTGLVLKGVYTPVWQAEMTFRENNQRIDFAYVRVPYDKVKDTDAPVTDDDYAAYLKENPHTYDQQEETRIINYVTINVLPTSGDSTAAHDAVVRMMEGLRAAASDSAYVVSNNGVYDTGYRLKANLPASVADSLLQKPLGTIIGPFQDQGMWSIAKIIDRKVIPDSVKARHILIRDASPANEKKIDSLIAILNAKTVPFDTLAKQNSQDQGSAIKGGDLGWFAEGAMVAEFNQICFFEGQQGKFYKVATQFGWHLIEITGKKFIKNEAGVKAAYLNQPIEPSNQTQLVAKDKALQLVQKAQSLEELSSLAGGQNYPVETSTALKANDFTIGALGAGDDSREIVRWAFDEKTKVSSISKEVFAFRDANGGYFDSKYVVAGLKSIAPKGPATIATLKGNTRAEQEVKNRKKAQVIISKLQNPGDLNALAGQWGVPVDTAKNSSMLQTYVSNGGSEPRVVGTAFSLAKDAVSTPVAGNSGVYVVKPLTDLPEAVMPPDLTLFRRQVTSATTSNVRMNLMNTMKKQANLKDTRSRFF